MIPNVPADSDELVRLLKQGEGPTLEFKRSTGELREGLQTACMFDDRGGSLVVTFRAPTIPGARAEPTDQVGTKSKSYDSAVNRSLCLQ